MVFTHTQKHTYGTDLTVSLDNKGYICYWYYYLTSTTDISSSQIIISVIIGLMSSDYQDPCNITYEHWIIHLQIPCWKLQDNSNNSNDDEDEVFSPPILLFPRDHNSCFKFTMLIDDIMEKVDSPPHICVLAYILLVWFIAAIFVISFSYLFFFVTLRATLVIFFFYFLFWWWCDV